MHHRTCIESLENRTLLAAAPSIEIIDGMPVANINWRGQQVQTFAGRWVVKLAGYSGYFPDQQAQAAQFVSQANRSFSVITHMAADGMFLVHAPETMPIDEAVSQLSALPGFISIEPDFRYELALTPNDPDFTQLWGLNNTGQSGGTVDADVDAPEGWNTTTGSNSVVVGMVDTGIDYNHPDLNDNIWINTLEIAGNSIDDDANGFIDDIRGWDFFSNDNDSMDVNSASHGTHTSGTVGAEGNNGVGVVGVNWNVKLIGMKIGSTGSGVSGAAAVSSMNYLLNLKNRVNQPPNIKVTNHSWGGGGFDGNMNSAIAAHAGAGIITVCAAGNAGTNNDSSPFYPANYNQPNNISVGNLTRFNARNSGSNYGATTVDLFAPGTDIRSTMRVAAGSYGLLTGTSMAAPHVAGAVALLAAAAPAATYQQIRDAIFQGVENVASLAGFCVTGGRLDLDGGLNLLVNIPATPSTPDLSSGSDLGQFDNDNITSDNTPTLSGTATAGLVVRIYADGVEVGAGPVDGSGNWSVTTSALSNGVRQITARALNGAVLSSPSAALPITIDTIAPTAGSPAYNYFTEPHSAGLVFSEDVGWSISNSDLEVQNLTNPAAIGTSSSYNGGTNALNMTFSGFSILPDADYRLTVKASGPGGGVQDVAGNFLAADFVYNFFFLMADADHDRRVNLNDFNILAANFGQNFRDFSQGDFTYDLMVNLDDFNVLASRFGTVLAGPDSVSGRPGLFGDSPISADTRQNRRSPGRVIDGLVA